MRLALLTITLITLAGCNQDRYQIIATNSTGEFSGGAVAYRLDKKTGEVIVIRGTQGRRVEMPQ